MAEKSEEDIFLEEGAQGGKTGAKPASAAKAPAQHGRAVPQIVELAVERGIRIYLTKTGYEAEGFYKMGTMRIELSGEKVVAVDKKEKKYPLAEFDDLVKLNYDCWKKSRDKGVEFINPGKEWLDEFMRLNLVKRQVLFIPGDE